MWKVKWNKIKLSLGSYNKPNCQNDLRDLTFFFKAFSYNSFLIYPGHISGSQILLLRTIHFVITSLVWAGSNSTVKAKNCAKMFKLITLCTLKAFFLSCKCYCNCNWIRIIRCDDCLILDYFIQDYLFAYFDECYNVNYLKIT